MVKVKLYLHELVLRILKVVHKKKPKPKSSLEIAVGFNKKIPPKMKSFNKII
jgi:hypothetical protein